MRQKKCHVCEQLWQKGGIVHLPNCASVKWDEVQKKNTSQKLRTKSKGKELMNWYLTQKAAKKIGNASLAGAKPSWSFAKPKGLVRIESTGRFEMNKKRH